MLNVPNIAGLPSAAGSSLAQQQFAQRAAVRITTTVINPYAQSITVIDLMCDPRLYQPAYLYSTTAFTRTTQATRLSAPRSLAR